MKFWVKYRTVFLYVGKNKFTYSPKFIFQNVLYTLSSFWSVSSSGPPVPEAGGGGDGGGGPVKSILRITRLCRF